MELQEEFIVKYVSEVVGFNGTTSKPYIQAMLNIELHVKMISINFYLVNYNASYNGLLGRGFKGKMGIVASLIYQSLKFPIGNMICKVRNNRWYTFKYEEESLD